MFHRRVFQRHLEAGEAIVLVDNRNESQAIARAAPRLRCRSPCRRRPRPPHAATARWVVLRCRSRPPGAHRCHDDSRTVARFPPAPEPGWRLTNRTPGRIRVAEAGNRWDCLAPPSKNPAAPGEIDQLVPPRYEVLLERPRRHRTGWMVVADGKPRQQAAFPAVSAASASRLPPYCRSRCTARSEQTVLEQRQGEIVAGQRGQHVRGVVEATAKALSSLRRGSAPAVRDASPRTLLGPQQLFAEG